MPPLPLKLLFILNPLSGNQRTDDWERDIHDFFLNSEHTIYFYYLNSQDNEISLKKEISKINPQYVIAVGGDGTVSLVAKTIKGSNMAIDWKSTRLNSS